MASKAEPPAKFRGELCLMYADARSLSRIRADPSCPSVPGFVRKSLIHCLPPTITIWGKQLKAKYGKLLGNVSSRVMLGPTGSGL